jgi:hypothetical protein
MALDANFSNYSFYIYDFIDDFKLLENVFQLNDENMVTNIALSHHLYLLLATNDHK